MTMNMDLVVIARNEARCIERCLGSARDHVQRMIVLDTGSEDDTVARARLAGAEVFHFDWCDDFSVARNHALALSQADWILMLDADEWLEAGQEVLRGGGGWPRPGVGMVRLRNEMDGGSGVQNQFGEVPRLLAQGVRYHGRIHEQVQLDGVKVFRPGVQIGHDGYRDAIRAGKGARNRLLLEAAVEAEPQSWYLRYQLGREWLHAGQPHDAARVFEQTWPEVPDGEAAVRVDLASNWVVSLRKAGDAMQALDVAIRCNQALPHSPELCYLVGACVVGAMDDMTPEVVPQWLAQAELCWTHVLELISVPGGAQGPEALVIPDAGARAAAGLAGLHRLRGENDMALELDALADALLARVMKVAPEPLPGE